MRRTEDAIVRQLHGLAVCPEAQPAMAVALPLAVFPEVPDAPGATLGATCVGAGVVGAGVA